MTYRRLKRQKAHVTAKRKLKKKLAKKSKGSLTSQVALSNAKQIKILRNRPEIKRVTANGNNLPANSLPCQMCDSVLINSAGTIGNSAVQFCMDLTAIPPPAAGANPAQAGEHGRVGKMVQMKRLTVHCKVAAQSGILTINKQQFIDLILVLDREPGHQIAVPTAMNVLRTRSDDSSPIPSDLAFYDTDEVNKTSRFKVLWRKKLWVQQAVDDDAPPSLDQQPTIFPAIRYAHHTIKAPYRFDYERDGQTYPQNQRILLLAYSNVISSGATPPTNYPNLSVVARFAYTDA